jgi:hypothetical protein
MIIMYKGKRREFHSVDGMMRRLGFNRISDEDRAKLDRAADKGDVMFVTNNPLLSELSSGEDEPVSQVLVADTQEALDEAFYRLMEEI